MQREIEALLKANIEDSGREARLIQNVLTALAIGSAARQRMIEEIQAAVGLGAVAPEVEVQAACELTLAVAPTPPSVSILKKLPKIATDEVALAISQLRAARDGHVTH